MEHGWVSVILYWAKTFRGIKAGFSIFQLLKFTSIDWMAQNPYKPIIQSKFHWVLPLLIAAVWLINGLYCKVLNYTPRHTGIVDRITGVAWARELTVCIGLGEIALGIWILWGKWKKQTAILQIALVLTMNVLEFVLVPELLLWGRFNLIFAVFLAGIIYLNAFGRKSPVQ